MAPSRRRGATDSIHDCKVVKLLGLYVVGDGRATVSDIGLMHRTERCGDRRRYLVLLMSYARQIDHQRPPRQGALHRRRRALDLPPRYSDIIAALGLSATQALRLLDFYHAAKQLIERGQAVAAWSVDATHPMAQSHAGAAQAVTRVDELITALRELCLSRTAGKIRTHLNCVLKNRHRFAYSARWTSSEAPAGHRSLTTEAIRRATGPSASRAHPSIGYALSVDRNCFSCGLSISPADGTDCSRWP